MADILIRGMEMPKHCSECFVKQCKHACYYVDPWPIFGDLPSRPGNCPLIALPEGHGRLIEANVITDPILSGGDDYTGNEIIRMVDEAPTIVPAEKEDVE